MQALNILVWAVALGIVNVSAAVLIVALALAMCLWPTRRSACPRVATGLRQRIRHLRDMFGTRQHPKHPTGEVGK